MIASRSQLSSRLQGLLITLTVMAGVLAIGVALAYRGHPIEMVLVIAVIIGAAVLAVLIHWPAVGLVAILATGMLVPFGLSTGSQTRVSLSLVVLIGLAALWVGRSLLNRVPLLPESRSVKPLIGLIIVAMLAFGFGQQSWFVFGQGAPLTAQLGGIATFALSAVAFLLAARFLQGDRELRGFTWIFLAISAILVLSRFVPEAGAVTSYLSYNLFRGSLFWTWLAAIAFSQALVNSSLKRGVRLALIGLTGTVFVTGIVHSGGWISGWVPPLAAVVAILLIALPRIAIVTGIAAAGAAFIRRQDIIGFIVDPNAYSLATRVEAWRIVAEIVQVNPVLGLGPANYYWYAPLFPILGYSVRFSSHNNYVDIVAQTGLLGLAFFMAFVVSIALLGIKLLKTLPAGFDRVFTVGVLGGLAGTLVAGMLGDWIIPFVYNVGMDGLRASLIGWMFLGGLVAVEQRRSTEG